jgi:hypothetical protein
MSDGEAKAWCDLFELLRRRAAALPDGSEELRHLARELVRRSRPDWESQPLLPPPEEAGAPPWWGRGG